MVALQRSLLMPPRSLSPDNITPKPEPTQSLTSLTSRPESRQQAQAGPSSSRRQYILLRGIIRHGLAKRLEGNLEAERTGGLSLREGLSISPSRQSMKISSTWQQYLRSYLRLGVPGKHNRTPLWQAEDIHIGNFQPRRWNFLTPPRKGLHCQKRHLLNLLTL